MNSEKYLFCGDSSLKMSVLGDINSEKVCMVWLYFFENITIAQYQDILRR